MNATLSPLATGTKVCAIGTDWEAEVVTSELVPGRFHKGDLRKSVLAWTVDVPAAGIRKGDQITWVQVPGRTPRYVILATD